jgi:hypothetical protein
MTNSIFSDLFDEAGRAASPQLPDRTAKHSDWSPSPLALIRSLADQLEASEARAAEAERQLAAHGRHCICRAGEIAAEEAEAMMAVEPADPSMAAFGGVLSLAA